MRAMPATPPAAPAPAERIRMPREGSNQVPHDDSSRMVLSPCTREAFDLTRQDFGEPLDRGLLQDRVVIARNVIRRDGPVRQLRPTPRRVTLKIAPVRVRSHEDESSGVGGRLIPIQGKTVGSIDLVASP